jgi:choline-sulfatase
MARRPDSIRANIVLILTDHFRPDALGKYTPHLMQLARRGALFTNAYCASPLCQPSRLSIVTGVLPSQHGVCGNQGGPIRDELRDDTFMRRLQEAGYRTAMIGKHHFLDRHGIGMDVRDDAETIRRYGFDELIQVVDDGENLHNDDDYTEHLRQRGKLDEFRARFEETAWDCRPHPFSEEDTVDGFIGSRGVQFVQGIGGADPFYLNLSFVGPHPPYWHPGELETDPKAMAAPLAPDIPTSRRLSTVQYQAPDLSTAENRAHYTDRCRLIDRWVGRLWEALERKDLTDRTLVIFTSDHGDNLGDYGIWDKRFFFENSCGVPLIMTGPSIGGEQRLTGNRISKALVSLLDLYPTILEAAGLEPPADCRRPGRSLPPMLSGRPGALHDAIFAELGTSAMIHTGNWKLVFDPEQGGVTFLFNLITDHREADNLAGRAGYESITARLLERLLSHRIRTTQYNQVKEEQRLQRVRVG